jgi:hypothetical protein
VLLLSSALPLSALSAQSLEQTAARERGRRESSVSNPTRVFTDDDLRTYAAQRPPEAASQPPTDQAAIASGLPPYAETPRQDAYGRHLTSAEAYVRQCEQRLQAAKESRLAASVAGIATLARVAVERAAGALERAKVYRDRAEVAARMAGAERAPLP